VWINLYKAERIDSAENIAKIAGVISTDEIDLQGESVKQDGLDFTYFLKKGCFNYEHKAGAENMLGYPTKVRQRKGYTEVEGVLLLDKPKAQDIYQTAQALRKAGRQRTLGFSIEGQVLERDSMKPQLVTKARVINCAITSNPINPNTSLELIKSIMALKGVGYQTPSQIDSNGISALVPQQLSSDLVNASSIVNSEFNLSDERLERTIRTLNKLFPSAPAPMLVRISKKLLSGEI
jgi:hypothetical protein